MNIPTPQIRMQPHPVNPRIRINSVGYLINQAKGASLAARAAGFTIRSYPGQAVLYTGKISHRIAGIAQLDFSDFNESGIFYLDIPGVGKSALFEVSTDVYRFPLYTVIRSMYLWRSGTAVSGDHMGTAFGHQGGHTKDGYLDYITGSHTWQDGAGGWYDAGDYGKYVVNAGFTLGTMFKAWEHFKPVLEKIKLDLPESNDRFPDYLTEIKWEMDWLLKMQYPDGSGRVSHKLTTKNFPGFIMPRKDTEPAYFLPWSSAATADFAAACAMAARVFKPYDPEYSARCLAAAHLSYHYLAANLEYHTADQSGFSTGKYENHIYQDKYDRLWAAVEMWETTGENLYLADFEDRALSLTPEIDTVFDWFNLKNLAMFTYLLSVRQGKNAALVSKIKQALIATADSLVNTAAAEPHKRPAGAIYYWGCNGLVARQTMLLRIADRVAPAPQYIRTALHALDHLLGRNRYCRSYVTGLGYNPPRHPHDRRSFADNTAPPWPGYLVGGGKTADGWRDKSGSYDTNEIAINWNSALIYALAGFV